MMMNYMNMGLDNPDPSLYAAQPGAAYGGPAYDPTTQAFPQQAPSGPPVIIDPRTGQPMAHPSGPNYDLGGWDGVSDKMRYLAQNSRYNRAAAQAQAGQSTSGMGGGGGGFGHLLHTIFGHNGGPGLAK